MNAAAPRELPRRVEPEWLDRLTADDPRARRTRHDLRRINRAMATLSIVVDGIDRLCGAMPPRTILDLGAGDGSLMLRVAKQRKTRWPNVAVTLLDRQPSIDALTLAGIRATGWSPEVVTADVHEWIAAPATAHWDLVVANLFIHHFDEVCRSCSTASRGARARSSAASRGARALR
jgi:2-polyprenyl-3-methyl-5-hydroxy-6-metoxy-1,4-benzoquinol methylase